MKFNQKDNFTDVVENLPQISEQTEQPVERPQQQVINNEGETITLGQRNQR